MQSQIQFECSLCLPKDTKCRKIGFLILKLTKIIQKEKLRERKLISLPSQQYFKHLVEYFGLQISENEKSFTQCSHKILKNYLIKKTGISVEELYCFSEYIFNSMGRRKFQLELIEKIAKNIHQKTFQTEKTQRNSLKYSKKQRNEKSTKNSLQFEFQTLQSIKSQKSVQNKEQESNQEIFTQKNEINQVQTPSCPDSYGHTLCNIGGEVNNYYAFYLPAGYQNQCFNYPLQGVQDLIPKGFLLSGLSVINN